MAEVSPVNLPSDECHSTLLIISQHWFRLWLDAIRQQSTTWANVDPDLCRHMASLGSNGLMHCGLVVPNGNIDLSQHWFRVMACCLMAPSHYLNQSWLLIGEVWWHSQESNFIVNARDFILHNGFYNHTFKIMAISPMGQWVNSYTHQRHL